MEDLIVVRRQRNNGGQWKSHNKPCIRMESPQGRFIVFKNAAALLNLQDKDAVMFAFSRKRNCAFIYKEEPQDGSYILADSQRQYYRFTCKTLMQYFIDFFQLGPRKAVYLQLSQEPDSDGRYSLTPENNILNSLNKINYEY